MKQKIIYTNQVGSAIDDVVDAMGNPDVFVIADVNTEAFVLPRLRSGSEAVKKAVVISCKAGDRHKDLASLSGIWSRLTMEGATRSSIIINVGGGVITDMGGFAASTFKRGIRFVNVPTTLLAAVDAAVGGKTGINFNGYKNEIGAFYDASAVIVSTSFFDTLPRQQLLSGYAEMLKHGLLEGRPVLSRLMDYDISDPSSDTDRLLALLEESVRIKQKVVEMDPAESGLRKSLNLGHTVGHAFESFAMEREAPAPHGYAVAWGLVVELILSHMQLAFPSGMLDSFASYIRENYGAFGITCDDYPRLLDIMSHDKKNISSSSINFSLLEDVGKVRIDRIVPASQIKAALDIYRDLMGI